MKTIQKRKPLLIGKQQVKFCNFTLKPEAGNLSRVLAVISDTDSEIQRRSVHVWLLLYCTPYHTVFQFFFICVSLTAYPRSSWWMLWWLLNVCHQFRLLKISDTKQILNLLKWYPSVNSRCQGCNLSPKLSLKLVSARDFHLSLWDHHFLSQSGEKLRNYIMPLLPFPLSYIQTHTKTHPTHWITSNSLSMQTFL